MIAFHGPREHLAHPLAQLELLCIFICGRWASLPALRRHCVWRAIGSGVRVVARVPPRHRRLRMSTRKYVCRRLFQVLSLISSSIRNGGSNRRTRESDPARVVSDFVMRYSYSSVGRRLRYSRRSNPVTVPAEVVGSSIGRLAQHRMTSDDV